MIEKLSKYIPKNSIELVQEILENHHIDIKIVNNRATKHGDFKRLLNGSFQITLNKGLNEYQFLITLIHEIAHFEAYKAYGKFIKPHGLEWKRTFQHLMLPFLNPEIFPNNILPLLAKHFINPKASSDTDVQLALALKQFDEPNNKTFIFEVPLGCTFKLYNGKIFKMGEKRVKRYQCLELKTGKIYLFNPNAEVELIN